MISERRVSEINWNTWQARDPATLMFVVKDDRILLIRKKRGLGAGKINGPGGRLEAGETMVQCAVREVQEELLITPHDPQYCGENLFQFLDGYSLHCYVYLSRDFSGTPTETEEAIPHWFALDEIPYEQMWEDDRLWLPLVLRRQLFSARFIFDGDRMLDHDIRLREK